MVCIESQTFKSYTSCYAANFQKIHDVLNVVPFKTKFYTLPSFRTEKKSQRKGNTLSFFGVISLQMCVRKLETTILKLAVG